MKQWNDIKDEFELDGSLRDIYVESIEPIVWDHFIARIKESEYRIHFSHGDLERELPDDFGTIREMQSSEPTILLIWISDNIQLNCHFFVDTEIELNVSPHDIQSEFAYSQLLSFLEWLASLTASEVKLTHEGMQEQVIVSVG